MRALGAAVSLALLGLVLAPSPAQAQTAARKFGRGLAAMTIGFLEIPGQIVTESRKNGLGSGLTLGFARGLGAVVTRELVGVYEFLTAAFPVPEGYAPILEPEFPWDHFEAETRPRR